MIADAALSSRRTQASASWAIVIPRPSAIGRSRCTAASTSSSRNRSIAQPMSCDAARVPSGGGAPGLYFPVSVPCASGDQTICEIPFRLHRGITSRSGTRYSIEYCGWEETNFSTLGTRSRAAWIWSAVHSLNPMYRALPARTTSVSASIVSSSGASTS